MANLTCIAWHASGDGGTAGSNHCCGLFPCRHSSSNAHDRLLSPVKLTGRHEMGSSMAAEMPWPPAMREGTVVYRTATKLGFQLLRRQARGSPLPHASSESLPAVMFRILGSFLQIQTDSSMRRIGCSAAERWGEYTYCASCRYTLLPIRGALPRLSFEENSAHASGSRVGAAWSCASSWG